jgi:DNA-binding NarL/FixJ family response regulator
VSESAGRTSQEEIVALLAIQVRLALGSQPAAVAELAKAGFPNARIAELLGTSANTVKVTLQRQRKATSQPKGAAADA